MTKRCQCGATYWVDDPDFFDPGFTIQEGIRIQQEQLLEIKTILKEEAFLLIKNWAEQFNHKAKCGHDVIRGQSLWDELHNLAIKG